MGTPADENDPRQAEEKEAAGLPDSSSPLPQAREVVADFEARLTLLAQTAQEAGRWVRMSTDASPASAGLRYAAAVWALGKENGQEASDGRARGELETELHQHILRFVGQMGELENLSSAEGPVLERSISSWDECFASYVEGLGESGRARARDVRKKAALRSLAYQRGESTPVDLMHLWFPPEEVPAPRFVAALAVVLWRDVVKGRLQKHPALVMAMHQPLVDMLSRVNRPEEQDGQRTLLLPGEVRVRVRPPAIDATAVAALMVDRGLKLFGSLAAHHLLRWQIFTAHRQALDKSVADPRLLNVDGGYSTLAHDILKMKGNKVIDQVRDIIEAEDACEIPLPPDGSYTRLLLRRYTPAQGRRRSHLSLVLSTALLPDYVHELRQAYGKVLEARRALRLVPVLELPPLIGRENERGPQATLSMLIVSYLRDHGRELVEQGGVLISPGEMELMAVRAGLPLELIAALLDRWTLDGDDGPAFLQRTESGRYTLADTYAAARAFIEEGARREQKGSESGKKSTLARRARIHRYAKPGR